MKVAICDDLKEDRQTLKNALYQLEKEKNIEFDILEFETPEALYKDCNARDELKIIFFDVYICQRYYAINRKSCITIFVCL